MKRVITGLLAGLCLVRLAAGDSMHRDVQFRRPTRAVLIDDGNLLAVANRQSGSITMIDKGSMAVLHETRVGRELRDVIRWPGRRQIVAVDSGNHQLLRLRFNPDVRKRPVVEQRIGVARFPQRVQHSPNGTRTCVSSLWSRRLTVLDVDRESGVIDDESARAIDLPFAPGPLIFIGPHQVLVAEAFGGRLAVVDVADAKLLAVRETPWHNLSQFAVGRNGEKVTFACQILNDKAHTETEHIHWGVLIDNLLVTLDVDQITAPDSNPLASAEIRRLGEAGRGAGDPSSVAVLPDRFLVPLAGTSELAILDRVGVREARIDVGQRPVHVVSDARHQVAWVVNELSDSIAVIDLERQERVNFIALGPTPEPGPAERGEAAFFNARLSLESWMSCHSCHTNGHTNNRLADTLGDGAYGNAKRVPSLLGVMQTAPWAWNGSQQTIEGQLKKTLTDTMHSRRAGQQVTSDLTAFLKSKAAPPGVDAARGLPPATSRRGKAAFYSAGCLECHPTPNFTDRRVFDVKLVDEVGNRKFNPPSLLGVSQRDRFLHDGRARSLEEVLIRFKHPHGRLSDEDSRHRIVQYLRSL